MGSPTDSYNFQAPKGWLSSTQPMNATSSALGASGGIGNQLSNMSVGKGWDANSLYQMSDLDAGLPSNWKSTTPAGQGSDNSFFGSSNLGFNAPTFKFGLDMLGSLYGLSNANKVMKMQKEAFDFQKNLATTNMNNAVLARNQQLDARANAIASARGGSSDQQAATASAYKQSFGAANMDNKKLGY